MARLVWTDRSVRFFDAGQPEEVTAAEVSFGQTKAAAKIIIRRVIRGQGMQPGVIEEDEVIIDKEKGKPAKAKRVSKGATASDRSARP